MTRESDSAGEDVPTRWLQKQIDLILKGQDRFDAKLDEIYRETQRTNAEVKVEVSVLKNRIENLREAQVKTDQNLENLKKTLLGMIVGLMMTVGTLVIQQWAGK